MVSTMFIRYFTELPMATADVEMRLPAAPDTWIRGLANDAEGRGRQLLASVGFRVGEDHRVDKQVQVP